MLKTFTFENSYCFSDSVTFDLSAKMTDVDGSLIPEQPELGEVIRYPVGRHGILPVAAIYGGNAGGKTKLIQTLLDAANDALGNSFVTASATSKLSPFEQMIKNRNFLMSENKKDEILYSRTGLIAELGSDENINNNIKLMEAQGEK